MSDPMWLRFLAIGEQLANSEPDLFPSVVCLLEEIASDNALRELIESAAGSKLPRPAPVPAIETLADRLALAEPALADVADLHAQLRTFLRAERIAAESWARAIIAARGDTGRHPTMPPCIGRLFKSLLPRTT